MAILKSKDKNFTKHKRPISKKNIDINEKVVSNKVSFGKKGFKYFIGYKKIGSLSILIKQDEILEKYIELWEKVKNSIKKDFDSEPVYTEQYLKAK